MIDEIKAFLLKYNSDISHDSISKFCALTRDVEFLKGQPLSKQGTIPTKFYIIKRGLIGNYLMNQQSHEFINTIYRPGMAVGALSSLIKREASNSNYMCLMDCDLYEIDYYDFINLSLSRLDLMILRIKILESIHIRSEKRINELSLLDGSQRYLNLKQDIPDIETLLPQYQIAHYLNISAVQLSRIRKNLYSK